MVRSIQEWQDFYTYLSEVGKSLSCIFNFRFSLILRHAEKPGKQGLP